MEGAAGVVPAGTDDEAFALAIQGDGKLVVAGYSYDSGLDQYVFALVRYNTDGTPDATFGTGGIVTTAIGAIDDEAFALAIQADGKLVVAGYTDTGIQYKFALVRYNTDGSLDTTFDGDGIVTTPMGAVDDEVFALAIQGDGKLVAAGFSSQGSPSPYEFALARYTTSGSLDPTFGTGGKVLTAVGTSDDEINAVAIQGDGKPVAAGFSFSSKLGQYEFAVARYTTDGDPDLTFNTTGIVTTAIPKP